MANTAMMYNVKNRSAGIVIYRIPEEKIRREFAPGETKKISYEELEKLTYQPGGANLIRDYLLINNDALLDEFNIPTEPEYFMTEEQVIDLIKNGTVDAWIDCLNFAPIGVMDLVKQFSVSIPLQDYEKRQILKEKTGFDIDAAIANARADAENTPATANAPARRTAGPERRTEGKYKVINTENN